MESEAEEAAVTAMAGETGTTESQYRQGEPRTTSSLFPLSNTPAASTTVAPGVPQWLSNSSFAADFAAINEAVSSIHDRHASPDSESESDDGRGREREGDLPASGTSYALLESSESGGDSKSESTRRKKKSKRRRKRSRERGDDGAGDLGSRKSDVRAWAGSAFKPAKDYYFDSRGDRDNLAFGSIYRMDVARHKLLNPAKSISIEFRRLYQQNGSILDADGDIDALDSKVKSAGRYWSPKYSALERHRNYKHLRILAPSKSTSDLPGDFISLVEPEASRDSNNGGSFVETSMVEESWEDEVLRKTREFNKRTRENPYDDKVWIEFAKFQDKVASRQPQKGARLQTLEKKIGILEKAAELNPENEELLLHLLKAYQSRDNSDVLLGRWEKILVQHSSSAKLWREFLRILQGEFSRFKVSEMRKMYSHAIQALSSACSKQHRQVSQISDASHDPAIVQLELGLVEVFISLCRFEWQAGYRELATALFQAEIEFSLFCPSLRLTENSKQRLFEHFWSSGGARVGEEGAIGWSVWLEKEEEDRQRIIKEETSQDNEKGGWTGWFEPLSKHKETDKPSEGVPGAAVDDVEEDGEPEDTNQEENTETLLKMLGIDVDTGPSDNVKDVSTWTRWSVEESSRDCIHWMPVHAKSGKSNINEESDKEEDEDLLGVILYEDVCEYLFSLCSEESRLLLVTQFVEFFGGKISQRICTNNSSWLEKILSLEEFSDALLHWFRRVHNTLKKVDSTSHSCSMEFLLSCKNDISEWAHVMTFLRNAILLCLTAFPRNYVLEEAALIAEELSVTKMNSLSYSGTPCRVLAKSLLKRDRQDILLCGVYAQREAVSGNIDLARKVFDMALSSAEVLPPERQSDAPLLYFWYAEVELSSNHVNDQESIFRAMHILCCLGSGVTYSSFKCQPSQLQLLRARQGFRERLRTICSAWSRGSVNDQSVALVCSAALFEELTSGWATGIEVLDQALAMVLPERRSNSYQLEYLYNYYVKILQRHHGQLGLSKIWDFIFHGLQTYPYSPELFSALVEISHLYTSPNKLRWTLDELSHKRPSVVVWLFALAFEMSRGGSRHRIHGLFERALANDSLQTSVLLWRSYISYEIDIAENPSAARRIFFRAIHACPWSKKLWLDGFLKLNSILSAKELSDLQEVMRDKELNLRTDIYEILLEDDIVS
ncbi:nuclear exosome regulator NRDE2 isoform X2 [Rhodamnia argentea]|uniref:Nuclear exosome regulator NRDE2 isoform X2 n=1 Tax=Rhodamnia argentea TaxID=178133 RepID=A0A8B8Q472_9MYRT|nr:nuclear exosome regulator NRDE2 isoform X2 [Rhodamnia argentea]